MSPQNDLVDLVSNIKRQSWGLGFLKSLPKSLSSLHVASSTCRFYRPLAVWYSGRTETAWSGGVQGAVHQGVLQTSFRRPCFHSWDSPSKAAQESQKLWKPEKQVGHLFSMAATKWLAGKCVLCVSLYRAWVYKMCYALGSSIQIKTLLLLWVIWKV